MRESLPPPLADVEFDHAAASDAVAAATRAIATLEEATAAREAVARAALLGAEGPYAVHLADQLDQARREAESHRSWLEGLRRQVVDVAGLATVEQIRRRAVNGELSGLLGVAS